MPRTALELPCNMLKFRQPANIHAMWKLTFRGTFQGQRDINVIFHHKLTCLHILAISRCSGLHGKQCLIMIEDGLLHLLRSNLNQLFFCHVGFTIQEFRRTGP